MKTRVAFFDVDDTLLKGSSGIFLARYMMLDRGEPVETSFVGELVKQYVLSRFGLIEYEKVVRLTLERFEGRTEKEIVEALRECYERYMVKNLYRRAVRQAQWHQGKGHHVVLLTASIQPLMEMLGAYLGATETIATKPRFNDGRLIGEWEGELCYAEGKRVLAQEYCERHGARLSDCYFYSDSISDMALLKAVGRPVAVNPDRPLMLQALLRNWRIMRFAAVLGSKPGALMRIPRLDP